MAKIKFHDSETAELLFVIDGTDKKGRRVICRYPSGVENTIFRDDLADTEILSLIGVESKEELALIKDFFNSR